MLLAQGDQGGLRGRGFGCKVSRPVESYVAVSVFNDLDLLAVNPATLTQISTSKPPNPEP